MSTGETDDAPDTGRPEYGVWKSVVQRCTNPRAAGYTRFGGRGVSIDPRWRGPGGFRNFLADVGPRPFPRAGLELVEPAGDFAPGNVRWADTRPCRLLTHDGRTMSVVEWARELNVRPSTLRARLHDGLPPERVFRRRVRTLMSMKPFRPETRAGSEFTRTRVTADSRGDEPDVALARAVEEARKLFR